MSLWPDPAAMGELPTSAPGVTRRHALWSADFPLVDCSTSDPPGQPGVISSYHKKSREAVYPCLRDKSGRKFIDLILGCSGQTPNTLKLRLK
jgi:hypothetical protein